MDEIIVRPKYTRQMSNTPRKRRRGPDSDMISTAFAAKLLVAVVFLSVFALCKAADTAATNFIVSKVKVIATKNYDVNKYIMGVTEALGVKLPQNGAASPQTGEKDNLAPDLNNSIVNNSQGNEQAVNPQNTEIGAENAGINDSQLSGQVQIMDDAGIKEIADKFAFITPIKGDIESPFGTRTDPLSGNSQFHSGIDIKANMGTSIKAALAGEVTEVGSNPEYDKYVKIQHNDGISTVYAHCSLLVAKKGQKVNQGDVIAKVGDSEGLPGAYLHFEVWKDSKAVDPEKLLNYLNQ